MYTQLNVLYPHSSWYW